MIRERKLRSYNEFFRLFFEREFPGPVEDLIVFLRKSYTKYGFSEIKSINEDALDIAFPEALNLIAMWSSSLEGELIIMHDRSSTMAKNKKIWDRVVHTNVQETVVGYDRRKMHFPLRVIRTELADSKDRTGLQIVDILAGAMTRCMKWIIDGKNLKDSYGAQLASFLPEAFGAHMIWPSPEFTPEELRMTGPDAADPIEHFVKLTKDLL